MILSDKLEAVPGLGYTVGRMQLMSGPGRRMLRSLPYIEDDCVREMEFSHIAEVAAAMADAENERAVSDLRLKLMQIDDIAGTIGTLSKGNVCNDVELFEVKRFSMLASSISGLIGKLGIGFIKLPDLTAVVGILDPQHTNVPHFYIYDCYDERLAELRRRMKETAGDDASELLVKCMVIEDEVRERLSGELKEHAQLLAEALENCGLLDIAMAKAQLAADLSLSRPRISEEMSMDITGLFNPQIEEALASKGKRFQKVDVSLSQGATVVTGANMSGKSVLLKTLALCEALFMFGFYVPAQAATLPRVDDILICIGDEQSEISGLSSFASEMLRIDAIVRRAAGAEKLLVLIDEPARTTNPVEGKALVEAIVTALGEDSSISVLTTHYGGVSAPCRRLRVRGFVENKDAGSVTARNVNDFLDYSLIEDESGDVPMEAMRIARLLGVKDELITLAEKFLGVPEG